MPSQGAAHRPARDDAEVIREFVDLSAHAELALRQGGADYVRQSRAEYEAIRGFLGTPRRILELGCGLGRMSVVLHRHFGDERIHFVLADADEVTHADNVSGWDPGRDFYNDLAATKAFCSANGLTNFSLFDLHRGSLDEIGRVDLLCSFLSVGFHFPIEESLHRFWPCLAPDATLIFGVRRDRYGLADFGDHFEKVHLVQGFASDYARQTRKQHFLVLERPRPGPPPPARRKHAIARAFAARDFWKRHAGRRR